MEISKKGIIKRTIHRLAEYNVLGYELEISDSDTEETHVQTADKGFALMKEGIVAA